MFPKFVDSPDTSTLNIIILMFTLDNIYIHHSLVFDIRTANAAAKEKRVSRDSTNTGISNCDLIMSILRRLSYANAK